MLFNIQGSQNTILQNFPEYNSTRSSKKTILIQGVPEYYYPGYLKILFYSVFQNYIIQGVPYGVPIIKKGVTTHRIQCYDPHLKIKNIYL